ncbi:MAG: DNA polymerase III subunit chi [Betaproteobacteria bacterium]|nr:DNA polymerase III subunit chi [Betaproteobacteria bacterium]
MTSIDFYFNANDRLQLACRLAGKAVAQGKRLLVWAPQADSAQALDRMMWTTPATGFVPHCMAHDALAGETPVLISAAAAEPNGCEILLNLGDECPPSFERFDRLLEVVSRAGDDRQGARRRYRFYRERGYPISDHDLDAGP